MDQHSEKLNTIHARVEKWYNQFAKSPEFQLLNELQQRKAGTIVNFFVEHSYNYLGLRPEEWDCSGVEECCTEIMPRKISAEPSFFEAVSPVLTAFFEFLAEKSILPNGHALAQTTAQAHRGIVQRSQDRSAWGMGKSFVMAAQEQGIDVTDPGAMEAYCAAINQRTASQAIGPSAPGPSS